MSDAEQYGTSPALLALPSIKEWNELPEEEKIEQAARFVEELYGYAGETND